jgi:hypothetical protein
VARSRNWKLASEYPEYLFRQLISEKSGPETMGGFGSGRRGGRPTVESALKLDIDAMIRARVIQPGAHVGGEMKFQFYDNELGVQFEALAGDPWNSWIRLRYVISDYWTGEQHEIDDKIYLAASRPRHGGLRWWFVSENRRVRTLYLPLGGRRFRSRHAYRLAYASQRETDYDRAIRRVRKLCCRLGGDLADNGYPEKPPRMRWATYNRIMDRIAAADRVADARLLLLLSKLGVQP